MASAPEKPSALKPGADVSDQASPHEHSQRGRGRNADSPGELPPRGWWDILKRTAQQLGEDNLTIVAAGVAFYAFLAMVPALAAVIAIYALFADPATVAEHVETMSRVMPDQARPLLQEQLTRLSTNNQSAGWGAVIGIGIALFGAMKAVTALITGLNITFDETERRGFLRLYLTAIALTLAGVVGAILVVALMAVAPVALRLMGADSTAQTILKFTSWPALAALFMFALAVIYRHAPCRQKARWRWVSCGAAAATFLWLAGSAGFAVYVSKFGGYEETYGSLGAVVVFLMWLYLSAYVILLGSELDAEMERQTKKDTTAGPARPMGQRGAFAADTLGKADD